MPSTGIWRGEVFAISDCLVMCMCVLDYASVVCMDGANWKTALATLIPQFLCLVIYLLYIYIHSIYVSTIMKLEINLKLLRYIYLLTHLLLNLHIFQMVAHIVSLCVYIFNSHYIKPFTGLVCTNTTYRCQWQIELRYNL